MHNDVPGNDMWRCAGGLEVLGHIDQEERAPLGGVDGDGVHLGVH